MSSKFSVGDTVQKGIVTYVHFHIPNNHLIAIQYVLNDDWVNVYSECVLKTRRIVLIEKDLN